MPQVACAAAAVACRRSVTPLQEHPYGTTYNHALHNTPRGKKHPPICGGQFKQNVSTNTAVHVYVSTCRQVADETCAAGRDQRKQKKLPTAVPKRTVTKVPASSASISLRMPLCRMARARLLLHPAAASTCAVACARSWSPCPCDSGSGSLRLKSPSLMSSSTRCSSPHAFPLDDDMALSVSPRRRHGAVSFTQTYGFSLGS